ncbi:MAG: AcrB/AcrD/AcrF family protein, partial [Candidatus Omnitrophica bacterium]|nr:AcrB/AcrD/AcrF family protein [Candidatus Omnitrophota bacterium]MBD3268998.1 AcrB/AcrD/AcrF family protein [Candidatus Omnitrophota bacterium]
MKISEFSVKHSLLINLISVFVILAGLYTLYVYKIRREAFPEVSFDMVVVTTVYPGAPPEELEKLVTVPIEKELKGVDGIEEMISSSIENTSSILVKISQDVSDKDKVVNDIKDAVDRVGDLPSAVEGDPVVREITSGEIPVVQVALSGDLPETELQEHAENLEDIFLDIPGVSSVSRQGWRDREVWIEVEPEKLENLHLSLEEIMQALARKNISIPGGKLRGPEEFSIRTTGEFHQKQEIENVIIRANDLGNWLRIKEVASVNFAFEDEDVINKSYGSRSINLTVIKRSSGDAVKIVEKVKKDTEDYLSRLNDPPKVSFINDISYYIQRRLGVLKNNGMVGIFLVCCVLMIFLNYRVALLTALGLPIAFFATVSLMAALGLSVNLITMFGLIIVLGMLVDDGIIIAENCSRYLEKGLGPRQAAVAGTEEVVKPVTVTIITTIAAFSPLMFMEGMLGKFIWGIPLVVIVALSCSLFEAFIILPSHFADFVKKRGEMERKKNPWFNKVLETYTRIVNWALNRRYKFLFGLVIVFILTIFLAKSMPFILFSSEEGIEQFYIRAEAPVGTNLYTTNKLISQIEEKVSQMSPEHLDAYTTHVGTIGETWMFDQYGKSGSHVAQVTVYLTPFNQRDETVNDIIDKLRKEVEDVEGFEKIYFEKEQGGPPVGKPVAVQIRGEDYDILQRLADKIKNILENIKGVTDIVSNYEVGRGEIRVVVDEDKATKAGLSVREIATSIRNAFRGGVATSIKPVKAEEEIDVLVRFPPSYRNDRRAFDKIVIPNSRGDLIPLRKVASLQDKVSMSRIQHLDGKRVITVRSEVDNEYVTSAEANRIIQGKMSPVLADYPSYEIEYGGEQEENVKSARSLMSAFILAFFLIFLILAANFNSLVQPAVVMMAIPFGLIG